MSLPDRFVITPVDTAGGRIVSIEHHGRWITTLMDHEARQIADALTEAAGSKEAT